MLLKLHPVPLLLLFIASFLTSVAANANPLAFFYDQSAFFAALSPSGIGPYPYDVIETSFETTISGASGRVGSVSSTAVTATTAFTNLGYNFTAAGQRFDATSACFSSAGCSVTGSTSEIILSLTHPVFAFAANANFAFGGGADDIFLNGQAILPGAPSYNGFFGVLSDAPIFTFDFTCLPGPVPNVCTASDNFVNMILNNILVEVVDEPSAGASIITGLLLLSGLMLFMSSRRLRLAVKANQRKLRLVSRFQRESIANGVLVNLAPDHPRGFRVAR